MDYESALEIKEALADIVSQMPTIRERIATAAMQGILADPNASGSYAEIAEKAVNWADALITELDKEKA